MKDTYTRSELQMQKCSFHFPSFSMRQDSTVPKECHRRPEKTNRFEILSLHNRTSLSVSGRPLSSDDFCQEHTMIRFRPTLSDNQPATENKRHTLKPSDALFTMKELGTGGSAVTL